MNFVLSIIVQHTHTGRALYMPKTCWSPKHNGPGVVNPSESRGGPRQWVSAMIDVGLLLFAHFGLLLFLTVFRIFPW
jgi:hypothetical protein